MVRVLESFDYRRFLADWFEERRAADPSFSQREFLRRAGITSSAVLHRILKGGKLPSRHVEAFVTALELSSVEADHFRNLVRYEDAGSVAERAEAYEALLRGRSGVPMYRIPDDAMRFFQRWYFPVVREVVRLVDGEEDLDRISRLVVPPITTRQAGDALRFLERNGFLVRDARGRLAQSDPFVSTGMPRKSGHLESFHRRNLEVNAQALDLLASEDVGMSSLTLAVSRSTYARMRRELARFRKRLLEMAAEDPAPEQVFHLNFLFLPRSRPTAKSKGMP
ncbi:MAG: TIGR02147 family protein [Fibrobacteria bacterium]|nr:TIGR02147 family protein [Fibrobacteria bacterium]